MTTLNTCDECQLICKKIDDNINSLLNKDISELQRILTNCNNDCLNDCLNEDYKKQKHIVSNNLDKIKDIIYKQLYKIKDLNTELRQFEIDNCSHSYERIYPMGPRDNNEYDLVCQKCNHRY